MDKASFDDLYHDLVRVPLVQRGFIAKGASLYLEEDGCQIAWLRGGGRLSSAGSIAHLAAFRHSFLRGMNEVVPAAAPRHAEHYPWLWDIEEDLEAPSDHWRFDPERHSCLPYGYYRFVDVPPTIVKQDLLHRREVFATRYIPWCLSVSRRAAIQQLRPHRKKWWIARLWLDDYQSATRAC